MSHYDAENDQYVIGLHDFIELTMEHNDDIHEMRMVVNGELIVAQLNVQNMRETIRVWESILENWENGQPGFSGETVLQVLEPPHD